MKILVTTEQEIICNMETLDTYLSMTDTTECKYAKDLVRLGKCLAYRIIDGEYHFYPSRFIGYKDNNMMAHSTDRGDGRNTNPRITKIIKQKLETNDFLESEYLKYLRKLGIEPCNFERTYWNYNF